MRVRNAAEVFADGGATEACLGGWSCSLREQCPHHTSGVIKKGQRPSERLCIRGRDGVRLVAASAFRTLLVDVFTGQEVGQIVEVTNAAS